MNMRIEFDVPIEMRDGTVLRADVYRPEEDGPWPVLISRLPYDKSQVGVHFVLEPIAAVRRGFIMVIQDTRGRFRSDGDDWRPFANEGEDGADTVRWAANLDGSNGRVGLLGHSYFGSTAWTAALERPEGLGAISPGLTWSDPYDGLLARGGARELGLGVSWALAQGVDVLVRRYGSDPGRLQEAVGRLVTDLDALAPSGFAELPSGRHPVIARNAVPELGYEAAQEDPDITDRFSIKGRLGDVAVPSLNTAGWFDIFLQGTIDNYVEASRTQPSMLVIGPWSHVNLMMPVQGEVNFGVMGGGTTANHGTPLRDLQLDWFDRWLRAEVVPTHDVSTQDTLGAPVRLFVMGVNRWRDEQEWPLERAIDEPAYFAADGALSAEPVTEAGSVEFDYDPADPVPTRGGGIFIGPEYPSGMFDQHEIEDRADVITFTTGPLEHDREVTGQVEAVLFAASDGPSTDWVVRLCDVDLRGVSRNVAEGILRVVGRPDEVAEIRVDLWSTSYVFLRDHRIRVQITSSCFPRWDRNLNTGESNETATAMRTAHQRLSVGGITPSRIVLPVIPADG